MSSSQSLAYRFREVVLNGKWVANTNFKQQLSSLDWKIATAEIGNLNTIAILAQHIHYYISGINAVFSGGSLDIRDKFSFDFPPIETQKEWDAFLTKFWHDADEFASSVEKIPDEKLLEAFVDAKYGTYQRNIDGMIEHCYYHLGQIVLIKKMLMSENL
jgi:hypothetical protein